MKVKLDENLGVSHVGILREGIRRSVFMSRGFRGQKMEKSGVMSVQTDIFSLPWIWDFRICVDFLREAIQAFFSFAPAAKTVEPLQTS